MFLLIGRVMSAVGPIATFLIDSRYGSYAPMSRHSIVMR